jgi:hypothetical protein
MHKAMLYFGVGKLTLNVLKTSNGRGRSSASVYDA